MSALRDHTRRLLAMLAGAPVVLAGVIVADPVAAAPPYTLEERAAAIASPALIYFEVQFSGYLRHRETGEALNANAIVISNRCSGFVVSAQGHALTSRRCLERSQESAVSSAAPVLANDMVSAGKLAADQKDAFIKQVLDTTEFTGDAPGSKPSRKVYGQVFQGHQGLTTEPAIPGEVISGPSDDSSDVALIKFIQNGLPVVEVGDGNLTTNAEVVLLGFATSDTVSPFTFVVRQRSAKVTGRFGTKKPVTFQIDGDLAGNSLGGMAVDSAGRVVGMINVDKSTKEPFRLITSSEQIKKVMADANVANSLAETDRIYREGLDAYFGGRYAEAIHKLNNVVTVMPDHALAASYRQNAANRLAIEGDVRPSTVPGWMVALTVGLAVALVVCLTALILLLLRNRVQAAQLRERPPLDVFAPVSGIPISVQPASGSPFAGFPEHHIHTAGPPDDGRPT
jgi:Trypsin-like peptidase domain